MKDSASSEELLTPSFPLKDAEYDRLGLIRGPEESLEEYHRRAAYCLDLRSKLLDLHPVAPKEEELALAEELYGIYPKWAPIVFRNKGLYPWHGGMAWIVRLTPEAPISAFLQLRKNTPFLYCQKELIAHEMAHIGRMAFPDSKFEELFAYMSSKNRLRRLFGPIVQSAFESILFVSLLVAVFIFDFFAIFYLEEPLAFLLLSKGVLFGFIGFALIRLALLHRTLGKCLKNLLRKYGDEKKARHAAYRMSDSLICQTADD